jgi:hypothetical protein
MARNTLPVKHFPDAEAVGFGQAACSLESA